MFNIELENIPVTGKIRYMPDIASRMLRGFLLNNAKEMPLITKYATANKEAELGNKLKYK
ncbi:MAG: hypothetical protein HYT70_02765 [Candidatus Aenigmarchaeota archaeon]|nr:hypothetical protein [Candidatus Aenigmarchaeota archaeon]